MYFILLFVYSLYFLLSFFLFEFLFNTNTALIFKEINGISMSTLLFLLVSPFLYSSRIFYYVNVVSDISLSRMGSKSCVNTLLNTKKGYKHFIPKDQLDTKKTLKRKLIDKITGIYRIFDKEGYCFIIHKFYFSPENFTLIKMEFLRIYEVDIF